MYDGVQSQSVPSFTLRILAPLVTAMLHFVKTLYFHMVLLPVRNLHIPFIYFIEKFKDTGGNM